MSETTFIYALKEPDTGEIRYIGKSDNPKYRLTRHVSEAKRMLQNTDRKNNWIRSLATKPLLEIVDEVPCEYWQQLEIAYIEFFREQGIELVNGTIGGDGTGSGEDSPSFGKPAWNRGIERPLEVRKKISESKTGVKQTLEHSQKCSAGRRGLKRSPETRKRQSDSAKGKPKSVEHRKNLSISFIGNTNPLGCKRSAECVAANRARAIAQWAKKKGQV